MSFQYAPWPMPAGVFAGWTTRVSGYSQGEFGNNNIARHVGDNPVDVEHNRALLKQRLIGAPDICWLNQTHSTEVVDVVEADVTLPQDGCYTQQKLKACAVMTADCLPVFLWSQNGVQVAAVHAGWRGLANGILMQALNLFSGSSPIVCGIGPSISPQVFEVGEEVVEAFGNFPNYSRAFSAGQLPGKFWCNLPLLAELQLLSEGAFKVYQSNLCTFSNPSLFYSFRREPMTGRMANLIWKV